MSSQIISTQSQAIVDWTVTISQNKGWWASTGLGKTSPEPPPVLLIVSDILDSEIHDRTRVLYSYSYLRGSYEIEADLTMH